MTPLGEELQTMQLSHMPVRKLAQNRSSQGDQCQRQKDLQRTAAASQGREGFTLNFIFIMKVSHDHCNLKNYKKAKRK